MSEANATARTSLAISGRGAGEPQDSWSTHSGLLKAFPPTAKRARVEPSNLLYFRWARPPSPQPQAVSLGAFLTMQTHSRGGARRKPSGGGGRASTRGNSRPNPGGQQRSAARNFYDEHLSRPDFLAAIEAGDLLVGPIRINPGRRTDAYVSVAGVPADIFLDGEEARNRWDSRSGSGSGRPARPHCPFALPLCTHSSCRALPGDTVVVQLLPPGGWPARHARAAGTGAAAAAVAVDGDSGGVAALTPLVSALTLAAGAAGTASEPGALGDADEAGTVQALEGAAAAALSAALYMPALPARGAAAAASPAAGSAAAVAPVPVASAAFTDLPGDVRRAMASDAYRARLAAVAAATDGGRLQPTARVRGLAVASTRARAAVIGTLRPLGTSDADLERPIPDSQVCAGAGSVPRMPQHSP